MKKRMKLKWILCVLVATLLLPFSSLNASAKELGFSSNSKIAAPESSVTPGTYYKSQTLELSTSIPNVSIYYTLDGTTPTSDSSLYTAPIQINQDVHVQAIAVREDNAKQKNRKTVSEVAAFTYDFVSRQEIAANFLSFTYKDMPYRLYVPENYNPKKAYPLVLFLHGGGERGTDNVKQIMANDGAVIWASPENQAKHEAFVLAPQARNVPDGGFGITRDSNNLINLSRVFEFSQDLNSAYEILQLVRSQYNIDSNRLYSTGLSQGGFGTYNLNMRYPDLFAAMVPIASGGEPSQASKLVTKPIWAFHAVDDVIIPVSYSRNIIAAIREAGGQPIYTEYPAEKGYNHASWVPAFENQEMIDWVFEQVKPKAKQKHK